MPAKAAVKTAPETVDETAVLEGLESLAQEIRNLSALGRAISQCALKRRTICLLLKDMSNVPMRDIEVILNNLPLLEKEFLK